MSRRRLRAMVKIQVAARAFRASNRSALRHTVSTASCAKSSAAPGVAAQACGGEGRSCSGATTPTSWRNGPVGSRAHGAISAGKAQASTDASVGSGASISPIARPVSDPYGRDPAFAGPDVVTARRSARNPGDQPGAVNVAFRERPKRPLLARSGDQAGDQGRAGSRVRCRRSCAPVQSVIVRFFAVRGVKPRAARRNGRRAGANPSGSPSFADRSRPGRR